MATKYNYKISTDFGGSLNSRQFQDEVEANAGITPTCDYIETYGDDVDVWFDSALSGSEQTTLNGLVSAHSASSDTLYIPIGTIIPRTTEFKSSSYQRVGTFVYHGTTHYTLSKISAVSYKDNNVTNYTIRIFDKDNNNEIASQTFTNDTEELSELTTISNLPSTKAIFEAQIKKTGGNKNKKVYCDSIKFYA